MSHEAHPNQQKLDAVGELKLLFQQAKGIYLADFTGLNVEEVNELRRHFHQQEAVYKVVKNTLIRKACEQVGYADLIQYLDGPTALALSAKDPVAPVRVIYEFLKGKEKQAPVIKGGWLEGSFLGAADMAKVKSIPSRDVLLSQLLSVLQAPLANVIGTLNEIVRSFVAVLEAIIQKKQAAGEGATPDAAEASTSEQ